MRALGFLLGSAAIVEAMRSVMGRPAPGTVPEPELAPIDEATFARWRAWAHPAPEADVVTRAETGAGEPRGTRLGHDPATTG